MHCRGSITFHHRADKESSQLFYPILPTIFRIIESNEASLQLYQLQYDMLTGKEEVYNSYIHLYLARLFHFP